MILVADIGNSHSRFAIFDKDKLARKYTEIQKIDLDKISKVILISVNEPVLLKLCQYLKQHKKPYEIIGSPDYHLPCKDKKLLKNLGADRAANILGGLHFAKGKAFIAIDCGTAITIDYCNEAGLFCGGIIFSGQQLMAQALHDGTDKLPLIDLPKIKTPKAILGSSTIEAMNSGLTYGLCDMIDGSIRRIQQMGIKNLQVFLCGGNADFYAKLSCYEPILQKDLTLWGGLCYAKRGGNL